MAFKKYDSSYKRTISPFTIITKKKKKKPVDDDTDRMSNRS